MKNILLLIFSCILTMSTSSLAQYDNVDFEAAGLGASWTWVIDQNDTNPALTFPANPVSGGINTSATVAEFTALVGGQPWALTYTDDIDLFQFDATNSTVKIMVYKTVISDVAIKFEGSSPAIEIKLPNTVVNQWEEITFDFSGSIGNTYNRLVIIPDFELAGRTQDNTVYFDNIQIPDGNTAPPAEPTTAAPTPTHDEVADNVISVYSGAYTDLANTDFNPNWGQLTNVSFETIAGNPTIKYENLNYQGTNLGSMVGSPQDVSGHGYIHVDFWTPDAATLEFYLISQSTGERKYDFTITAEQWVSVDIPLHHFTGQGLALTDIFQFKVVGNGKIWFDNWYFHSTYFEPAPLVGAPIPDDICATSIYSDTYNNIPGSDYNPSWGQQTIVTGVDIGGNNALKYANLNYQGTIFGSNQDVSGYDYLHVDYWTANSTDLGIYLISPGPLETEYVFTIQTEQWVSVDIPLTHFAGVDLTDAFQFKVEGNGTVWFDNLYFHSNGTAGLPATGVEATINCTAACDNASWSYYEDPANPDTYLFAIEWDPGNTGNNAAAKAGAQVTIDIDPSFTMADDGTNATWSMGRYWNVTPGAPLVDPVNVKFFYDAAEMIAIETEMNNDGRSTEGVEWFKTTGVNFDPSVHVTGPAITGNNTPLVNTNTTNLMENGVLYAQFDGITSFSGGTAASGVGNSGSPLPVELVNFWASTKGKQIELAWETATEVNNAYFEIERSQNGRDFEFINKVEGKGSTSARQLYQSFDNQPYVGINYYRLKQVDLDGTFNYSNIVTAEMNLSLSDKIKLYPIPVQNQLTIDYSANVVEEINLTITDAMGRVVISKNFTTIQGENQLQVDCTSLPKGSYFLKVQSSTNSLIRTVIK